MFLFNFAIHSIQTKEVTISYPQGHHHLHQAPIPLSRRHHDHRPSPSPPQIIPSTPYDSVSAVEHSTSTSIVHKRQGQDRSYKHAYFKKMPIVLSLRFYSSPNPTSTPQIALSLSYQTAFTVVRMCRRCTVQTKVCKLVVCVMDMPNH